VVVGSDPVISLAKKRFRQQLGVDLQLYETMEDALTSVRTQIALSNPM
jgi:hypothetical protein